MEIRVGQSLSEDEPLLELIAGSNVTLTLGERTPAGAFVRIDAASITPPPATPSLYPAAIGRSTYVPSTGVAATDTAALQAAHDSFGATGGTITLDAGPYQLTEGGLVFTKAINLLGVGPANAGWSVVNYGMGSLIYCDSATGNAITARANLCCYQQLCIINTHSGAPTAGAGISFPSAGGGGEHCKIIDCTVVGFYNCYDFVDGVQWTVTGCWAYDFVNYGIGIQNTPNADGGDSVIHDCQIYAGPTNNGQAGINWQTSGGLKISATKINTAGGKTLVTGIGFGIPDGKSTSVLLVTGNSIENVSYGVLVQQGGTGTGILRQILVTGNEIFALTASIVFSATQASKIFNCAATGNVLATYSTTGNKIFVWNVDSVYLSNNVNAVLQVTGGAGAPTNLHINAADFSFTTVGRPAATVMAPGASYYDTTLSKPAWSNGTNWKDAAGTNV